MVEKFETQKRKASDWFLKLRGQIVKSFEGIEYNQKTRSHSTDAMGRFSISKTKRNQSLKLDAGGGVMSVMRDGLVFEKVGVNVSTVYGPLDDRIRKLMQSRRKIVDNNKPIDFWASGISVVAHMKNPHCPAIHMNTRMFWTPDAWWFGGGSDLNPSIPKTDDTSFFHTAMKDCCDRHDLKYYIKFKKWADEYFFIPHRNVSRGVGGIFFDDLSTDWDDDFAFVKDVGTTFLSTFEGILDKRIHENWTEAEKDAQLRYRGLYSEYNLIYDRGTKFGLESGHDPNAVLMSLPPLAKWV